VVRDWLRTALGRNFAGVLRWGVWAGNDAPMTIEPDTIAALIREVAQSEILPRFRTLAAGDIHEKRPGDFVTAADIAAERALARRLPEAVPGAVVLGEEAVHENPERMRLLRGHVNQLAALEAMCFSGDGDFGLSFQHLHQRVEGGCVLA